jgi:hypothetical protein
MVKNPADQRKQQIRLYKIIRWFLVFKDKEHPIRVVTGALAASALGASLALASIENRTCSLNLAAYCFSAIIIPLAMISVGVWPVRRIQSFWYWLWVAIFLISIVAFVFGVFCLIINFSKVASIISFFASLAVLTQILSLGCYKIRRCNKLRGSKAPD